MTATDIANTSRSGGPAMIWVDTGLVAATLGGLLFVPVIGSFGALIFLASGLLLAARRPGFAIGQLLRFWPLLILPTWCLVSFAWSQFPDLSLRFGLQFAVTVAIAVIIAVTIPARQFVRVAFVLYALAMAASLLFGDVRADIGAWLGIFGSKNAFAGAASVFLVLSAAALLDYRNSTRFRVMGLAGTLTGAAFLALAQSVSAIMVAGAAGLLLPGFMALRRMSGAQRFVAAALGAILLALAGLLIWANLDALLDFLLRTTEKDLTLTGRTDLWHIALGYIREHPLGGLGYQAFWVRGYPPAEQIWYMFGIDSRGGFNFHNTYLSNAVEIGVIGVALQVFVLYGAAALTLVWALRSNDPDAALLFALVAMVVMTSFVEVPVFFQFSLRSVMVICALVYGARGIADAQTARLRRTSPSE